MKNRCAESAQYDYRLADVRWGRACRAALCGLAMACTALGVNAQGPAADPSSATSPGAVTTAGASRAKLTTIILRNLERTSMNETPVTFGQVFKPGDVPKGATLQAVFASGEALPLQVDAKATHADGSLRHGVITTLVPRFDGKKPISIDLIRTAARPDASVPSQSAKPPRELAAKVLLVIEGKQYSVSMQEVFKEKSFTAWLAGPLVSEWCFASAFKDEAGNAHPHLALKGSLRVYRNGAARFDIALENGWAYAPAPRDYNYDVSVALGTETVYTKSGLLHYHLSRWRKVFWWGAARKVHVGHDARYLIETRAIPTYDMRVGVAQQTLDRYAKKLASPDFEPMGKGLAMPGMRTTGGRPEIGPLPDWAAAQILSQDAAAWSATLAMGDLSGSWPIHYRDQKTDLPATLDDYPYMTLLGNQADAVNKRTGKSEWFPSCAGRCKTPFAPDSAHQPSFAYLPYLISGDYYYLEELLFWANWNLLELAPPYRQFEKGLLKPGQVRAQAWGLRTLAQAAYIAPDSHPLKRYFIDRLNWNLDWYNDKFSNNPDANKLGVLTAGSAIVAADGLGVLPWQDDFFTWAVGYTWALGFPQARPLLRWKAKFSVGRMIDPDFCWVFASDYILNVRASRSSEQLFESFREVYQATIAARANSKGTRLGDLACDSQDMADWRTAARNEKNPGATRAVRGEMVGYPYSPEGFPAILQPALAAAVDADIPGASKAWQRFLSRAVPSDYRFEPQFAIVPFPSLPK